MEMQLGTRRLHSQTLSQTNLPLFCRFHITYCITGHWYARRVARSFSYRFYYMKRFNKQANSLIPWTVAVPRQGFSGIIFKKTLQKRPEMLASLQQLKLLNHHNSGLFYLRKVELICLRLWASQVVTKPKQRFLKWLDFNKSIKNELHTEFDFSNKLSPF